MTGVVLHKRSQVATSEEKLTTLFQTTKHLVGRFMSTNTIQHCSDYYH